MFRRKRNSIRTPQNPNPSPSAQTAAAQAFLASQASNAQLSSAAAATALRTHTPTPTPIENVQTKRMLQRRSSSSSSRGIQGEDGAGGRGLHRSTSSGSMTTRTFRDPSPGGHPSSDKVSQTQDVDVPPVPPLPQNYPKEMPHRRTSSMEPLHRPTSPPQARHSGGRGGSLDRSVGRVPTGGSPSVNRYSSLRSVPEGERPVSRGSINFSYPINPQSNSPRQSPVLVSHRPNNDALVNGSAHRGTIAQDGSTQTGDRPKKKKKKKAVNQTAPETSLATSDPAVEAPRNEISDRHGIPPKEEAQPPPSSHTISHTSTQNTPDAASKKKKKKKKRVEQESTEQYDHVNGSTSSKAYVPGQERNVNLRSAPVPKKRPSIVREDPEGEEREEGGSDSPVRYTTEGSSATHDAEPATKSSKIPLHDVSNEVAHRTEQPVTEPPARSPSGSIRSQGEADQGKWPVDFQSERPHSLSPTRSTRFSSRLAATSTGEPLHEPPPRSLSPAKSALKSSHHPPQTLPPDSSTHWPRSTKTQSETSEGTSATSEDGSRAGSKKKSVKVSFEDEAEIVGTAASPPTSPESAAPLSPLGKSTAPRYSWPSIDRSKAFNDDDGYGYEDVMKPRPALPSFGSVRGRKEVIEEDPSSDLHSDASSMTSSASNLATLETSWSSDHALGHIIAPETKRAGSQEPPTVNHATHAKEPLPPQVTSVEGTGYGSDSDGDVRHDTVLPNPTIQYTSPPHSPIKHQNGGVDSNQSTPSRDKSKDSERKPNGSVPLISVLPATPALEEEREFPGPPSQVDPSNDMPESFTGSEPTPTTKSVEATEGRVALVPESSDQPAPSEDSDSESDSSGDSVYSDAAEDLSELEGSGFGSINTIVESPVTQLPNAHTSPRTPPESPLQSSFNHIKGTESPSQQGTRSSPPRAPAELLPSVLPVVEEEPPQDAKPMKEKKQKAGPSLAEPLTLHTTVNKENAPPSVSAPMNNTKVRRPTSDEYGVSYSQSFQHANGQPPSTPNTTRVNSVKTTPITQTKTSTKKKTRPTSSNPVLQSSAAASALASQIGSAYPQGLHRTLSNGSDSSSSFKRPKRQSKPEGRYTMRRTMRSGSGFARPWSQDGAPSNSIRSLSPQGRRPFSSGSNGSAMRMTLRGPSNADTIKRKDENQKSSTFPRFGKSASLKKSPGKSGGTAQNAKFASRFENFSEEDVIGAKNFRSRFEDSSDDEPEVEKYTPVRGIPRRKDTDDGDSTDLEDSSDDETGRASFRGPRRRSAAPAAPLTGSAISTSAAVAASRADTTGDRQGDVRGSSSNGVSGNSKYELEDFLPVKEKKPSLFHRLTLSKRDRNKDKKIHKSKLDSAARRDTSLERSRVELERMRLAKLLGNEEANGSNNFQTTITGGDDAEVAEQRSVHASSSKLRKKPGGGSATNKDIHDLAASGSWPLRAPPPDFYAPPEPILEKPDEVPNHQPSEVPATTADAAVDRPHTADGVVKQQEPKSTQPPPGNAGSPASAEASWTSRFRPRLHRRQGTDSTLENSSIATSDAGAAGSGPTTVGDVVVDKGSRRKKFPLLRRALGIGS